MINRHLEKLVRLRPWKINGISAWIKILLPPAGMEEVRHWLQRLHIGAGTQGEFATTNKMMTFSTAESIAQSEGVTLRGWVAVTFSCSSLSCVTLLVFNYQGEPEWIQWIFPHSTTHWLHRHSWRRPNCVAFIWQTARVNLMMTNWCDLLWFCRLFWTTFSRSTRRRCPLRSWRSTQMPWYKLRHWPLVPLRDWRKRIKETNHTFF